MVLVRKFASRDVKIFISSLATPEGVRHGFVGRRPVHRLSALGQHGRSARGDDDLRRRWLRAVHCQQTVRTVTDHPSGVGSGLSRADATDGNKSRQRED